MSTTPTTPTPCLIPRTAAPSADRRRLKTETSASGGWAMRLQAMIEGKSARRNDVQRPQRPASSP